MLLVVETTAADYHVGRWWQLTYCSHSMKLVLTMLIKWQLLASGMSQALLTEFSVRFLCWCWRFFHNANFCLTQKFFTEFWILSFFTHLQCSLCNVVDNHNFLFKWKRFYHIYVIQGQLLACLRLELCTVSVYDFYLLSFHFCIWFCCVNRICQLLIERTQ